MYNSHTSRGSGRPQLDSAIAWLGGTLALAASFLVSPQIDVWSNEWVVRHYERQYGYGFRDFASWGWTGIVYVGVFCAARFAIAVAVMLVTSSIILRFVI